MKATLIAVACLLVVAGVALVLLMSGNSDPAPTKTAASGSAQVATQDRDHGGISTTPAPSLGSDVATNDHPTEYMIGDTKIRDHRSGSNAPLTIPPNPHAADQRSIPSELTHDISQQVRKVIYACSGAVPKDARGAKPRVIGQLQIAIKDQKLSIKSMTLDTQDITDPTAASALTQCTQEKSSGFTSVAKDQADLDNYGIQLNFVIP